MKKLILVLVLSSTTVFANPFSGFVGQYDVASTPQISMTNMSYCNWLNFSGMTSVTIFLKSNTYVADIASKLNNSPLNSYLTFEEYSYSGDFGVTNTAKVSNTTDSATYQKVSTSLPYMGSSGSFQSDSWTISKVGSAYHLRVLTRVSNGSVVSTCTYDVDLRQVF